MPRPTKCRPVCSFPEIFEFFPAGEVRGGPIPLTVDEFETIRRKTGRKSIVFFYD